MHILYTVISLRWQKLYSKLVMDLLIEGRYSMTVSDLKQQLFHQFLPILNQSMHCIALMDPRKSSSWLSLFSVSYPLITSRNTIYRLDTFNYYYSYQPTNDYNGPSPFLFYLPLETRKNQSSIWEKITYFYVVLKILVISKLQFDDSRAYASNQDWQKEQSPYLSNLVSWCSDVLKSHIKIKNFWVFKARLAKLGAEVCRAF